MIVFAKHIATTKGNKCKGTWGGTLEKATRDVSWDPVLPGSNPPPCRQARQGVFGPSSGGLMSGICLFLRGPQPVTRTSRVLFFEPFFGSHFLMILLEPNDPRKGPSWAPCWFFFGIKLANFSDLFKCLSWILTWHRLKNDF